MDMYQQLRDPVALSVFLGTLLLPILVGLIAMFRTKNQSDFFIGGRAMNKFVVALSAVSSGRSSWLVLGVSGMAYIRGVGAVWAVVGYITAEMFQFVFIGRRLRTQSEAYGSLTLLDYLESRHNDDSHLIRIVGACIIGIFVTAYVAAQFNAGALSLSTGLGLPQFFSGFLGNHPFIVNQLPIIVALLFGGLLILIYMVLGGYIAVAYNDVIRAIIMILGLIVLPLVGLIKLGGLNILLETLSNLNPAYVDSTSLGAGVIIGFLGIGLGSPGQPHILVRYMSIDDPDRLRQSTVIGTSWNVLMAWGAVFIGLLGRVLIPQAESLPDGNSEMIYLALASNTFDSLKVLGPVLYGLLLGGIFAAILSTADSQLLVIASTFVRDIYEKILRRGAELGESLKLRLSRWVVIFSGILALILAYAAKDLIFWLVLFAWGGLGASFGTTMIFSLYWKKTSKFGVIAGMVTGTLVTIGWKLFLKDATGIYELIPAFAVSAIALVVFSLLFKNRSEV